MTNEEVLDAWLNYQPGTSKNLSSRGGHLYSYQIRIGTYTWSNETPIIFNYRHRNRVSRTTSKHVTQAVNRCESRGFTPTILNPNTRE